MPVEACRRVTAISLLLISGCDRPATQHEPDRPQATVSVVAPTRSTDRGQAAQVSVQAAGLVGRLVENKPFSFTRPSEYCLDDGHVYAGAPVRIGDLNIFGGKDLQRLVGEVVLVRGRRETSLLAALQQGARCPEDYGGSPAEMPQMRSDWMSAEGGFLTTRAKLKNLPCFRATEIATIDLGSELEVGTDEVTVVLRNPFDVPLDGLTARAHYEGGPGKPMPRFEPIGLKLPPGASQRITLAAQVEAGPAGADEGQPRGIYTLASVDLDGRVDETEFAVSIPVSVPRRPRKR